MGLYRASLESSTPTASSEGIWYPKTDGFLYYRASTGVTSEVPIALLNVTNPNNPSLNIGTGALTAGAANVTTLSASTSLAVTAAADGTGMQITSTGSPKLGLNTPASGSYRNWEFVLSQDALGDMVIRRGTSAGAAPSATVMGFSGAGAVTIPGTLGVTGGIWPGATQTSAALISQASSGAGTTTTYIGNQTITTASDIRLKANIVDTQRDALAIFGKLRVVDHTWDDPTDVSSNNRNARGVWTGLIAQEAIKHIPWLVNKPLSDADESGKPQYWFMDYAYMAPLFVLGFQQVEERLRTLENRIGTLQ